MTTLIETMTRIEQGQATAGDLDLLVRYIQTSLGANSNAETIVSRSMQLVEAIIEIVSTHELEQIAQIAATKALELFGGGASVLLHWDEKCARLVRGSQETDPLWNDPFTWPDLLEIDEASFLRPVLERQELVCWTAGEAAFDAFFQHTGVSHAVAVPVSAHRTRLGVLVLLQRSANQSLSPFEEFFLRLLANATGVSLENTLQYQAECQHSDQLESLHRASLALTASLDLHQVLNAILQSIFSLLRDAKDAHIFHYDGQSLEFGAALWWNGRRDEYTHPRVNGITHTVATTGEAIVVTDMQSHDLFHNAPANWSGSIIGLPLKIGARVVGVLNVARVETVGFTPAEMRVLRLLADQAAMAIENARLHNLILQQALTDPLTGLPNRRAFDQRLTQESRRSARYQHPFVLLMMDLDHFKEINDHFGHLAGDSALKQIAELLNGHLRDTDFLARYGGDEFAFILPETGEEGAQSLINQLNETLRNNLFFLSQGQVCTLSGCFGIAVFPNHASSHEELIGLADQRLYAAKNAMAFKPALGQSSQFE